MRAKLPAEDGYVDRDGVNIYYEIYGSGGETLVFIPPWSIFHSRVYKAQLPHFSERYRCIAYDGRGNGKSGRPAETAAYSLENYVADALAVMDATATDNAVLVGLSFGGMIACALAAHHSQRVRAVVLVGTSASIGPAYHFFRPAHFNAVRERFEGWEKYNLHYWQTNYPEFVEHFVSNIFPEPHSSKQIEDGIYWASGTTGAVLARTVEARAVRPGFDVSEAMFRKIGCPLLLIHGEDDRIQPHARAQAVAEATGGQLVTIPGGGHNPLARFPAKCNVLISDFIDRTLHRPVRTEVRGRTGSARKILYLSSPIGLGHGRRDIAVARELRKCRAELDIHWLAQDPVTRLLTASGECIHPLSARLASESQHIELESRDHDLHVFQAIRRMDEILIANFMVFQTALEEGEYDLVIGDEAWDVDHFWHEHPELKKAKFAWLTDFVGYVPMPEGGEREAFLTADYNAEMIGHVERHSHVRDRAIFVGNPEDVLPQSFGRGLPAMRDWVPEHFDFSGYILAEPPQAFGRRAALREQFGYREDERICIATAGGSGVGVDLLRRIAQSYALVRPVRPELRMILVAGPRIDPAALRAPPGVEVRSFMPDLNRHLAACDVALVQGGLTTCMELTAAGTPFIAFPLKNHFEQIYHVAHRLDRYGAGRRLAFEASTPSTIAKAMLDALQAPARYAPVEADGAIRAAKMILDLL